MIGRFVNKTKASVEVILDDDSIKTITRIGHGNLPYSDYQAHDILENYLDNNELLKFDDGTRVPINRIKLISNIKDEPYYMLERKEKRKTLFGNFEYTQWISCFPVNTKKAKPFVNSLDFPMEFDLFGDFANERID